MPATTFTHGVWPGYKQWEIKPKETRKEDIARDEGLTPEKIFKFRCLEEAEKICAEPSRTPASIDKDPSFAYRSIFIADLCDQEYLETVAKNLANPYGFFHDYKWQQVAPFGSSNQYTEMVRSEGRRSGDEVAEMICPPEPDPLKKPEPKPTLEDLLRPLTLYSADQFMSDVRARLSGIPKILPQKTDPVWQPKLVCNFPIQPFAELPAVDWCTSIDPSYGIPSDETLNNIAVFTLGFTALITGIYFINIGLAAETMISPGSLGGGSSASEILGTATATAP